MPQHKFKLHNNRGSNRQPLHRRRPLHVAAAVEPILASSSEFTISGIRKKKCLTRCSFLPKFLKTKKLR